MNYQSYLESRKNFLSSEVDKILEEIDIVGYSVVGDILSIEKLNIFREVVDEIWHKQVNELGEERLRTLKEWGVARALLFYDPIFTELVSHDLVMKVVSETVGETAILHLINGIISFPNDYHHQSNLHRDFAKDFVSNKPLSINAYWVLDAFNEKTGAIWVIPYTHKTLYTPSDEFVREHAVQITASLGSLIFFDSRIYHKAGVNFSNSWRRGINTQYTKPFIKQQIDLPILLKDKFERETPLGQTLGMWSVPPKSVQEFRVEPNKRTYKSGQG